MLASRERCALPCNPSQSVTGHQAFWHNSTRQATREGEVPVKGAPPQYESHGGYAIFTGVRIFSRCLYFLGKIHVAHKHELKR